jgi:hypothetical protein
MNANITDHPAAMLETEPNEWNTRSSHTKKALHMMPQIRAKNHNLCN